MMEALTASYQFFQVCEVICKIQFVLCYCAIILLSCLMNVIEIMYM